MDKYLVTIQAYIEADSATTAENIAVRTVDHLLETNEDPAAGPTVIQTCVVQKAPFVPLGSFFWAGESCESDIEAEERR